MMITWVPDILERKVLRRQVRANCQVVAEEGFRLLGIRTLDLSDEGLLLHSSASVAVGERVFVSLEAPGMREWVDAEAVVARVIRGRRDTDMLCGVGLSFVRMDPLDRAILRASLVDRPPPVPARHPRKDYVGSIAMPMLA
jgi:hypothetical protein